MESYAQVRSPEQGLDHLPPEEHSSSSAAMAAIPPDASLALQVRLSWSKK